MNRIQNEALRDLLLRYQEELKRETKNYMKIDTFRYSKWQKLDAIEILLYCLRYYKVKS